MHIIQDFQQYLPHRPPFLLVDQCAMTNTTDILSLCIVNRHIDLFQGHFPTELIMPGVLIVETMAQTGCIALGYSHQLVDFSQRSTYLTTINQAKFRQVTRSTDRLLIQLKLQNNKTLGKSIFFKFTGMTYQVHINDLADFHDNLIDNASLAASCEFTAALVEQH